MVHFLWRLAALLGFFTVGTFLTALFAIPSFFSLILYLTVVAFILVLPFKRALMIVVPALFMADILNDQSLGPLFFFGLLLAVATAFFSVRVQKGKRLSFATLFYILLAALFSCFSLMYQTDLKSMFFLVFFHTLFSLVFFLPVLIIVENLEAKLDTSFREAAQKIR